MLSTVRPGLAGVVFAAALVGSAQVEPDDRKLPSVSPLGPFAFELEGYGSLRLVALSGLIDNEMKFWDPEGNPYQPSAELIAFNQSRPPFDAQYQSRRLFFEIKSRSYYKSGPRSEATLVGVRFTDTSPEPLSSYLNLDPVKQTSPSPNDIGLSSMSVALRLAPKKDDLVLTFFTNVTDVLAYASRSGDSWSSYGGQQLEVTRVVARDLDGRPAEFPSLGTQGLYFVVRPSPPDKIGYRFTVLLAGGARVEGQRVGSTFPYASPVYEREKFGSVFNVDGVDLKDIEGFQLSTYRTMTVSLKNIRLFPKEAE